MIIFSFPNYKKFTQKLIEGSDIKEGEFTISRFPDLELYLLLKTNVVNQECLVVGNINPPDENLLATLLLCHTLKKEGALKVTLILPYMAYARQDKHKPGESMATSLVASMISFAGVDKVITVDVHSQHVAKLFPIPFQSLSIAELFAQEINKLNLGEFTLVAPDANAHITNQEIAKHLKGKVELAYLEKERKTGDEISHLGLQGEVLKNAVIVDDILETGGSLVSAVEILKDKGAEKISIFVTHGIFAGSKWRKLFEMGVEQIFITNTLGGLPSVSREDESKIKVISIIPLLRKALGIE